jgi:hypothetical protein
MTTPQQRPQGADPSIVEAITELRATVATLTTTMRAIERRLHLVYTVVVLAVGVVGGPNALQLVAGH